MEIVKKETFFGCECFEFSDGSNMKLDIDGFPFESSYEVLTDGWNKQLKKISEHAKTRPNWSF